MNGVRSEDPRGRSVPLTARLAALLLTVALAPGLNAEPTYLLVKGVLDVASGEMLRDRVIVIEDGTITAVNASAEMNFYDSEELVDFSDRYATPGFIDMHVHLHSDPSAHGYRRLGQSLPQQTIIGVTNARRTLRAGVTTVRMVGAPGYAGVALRDAINTGEVEGPRILTAGIPVGITGGHCADNNLLPFEADASGDGVADSPWAARAKVRQNVKFGADLIKTCSTGGVLSKGTEVGAPQGTLDELTAIVEEAHGHGLQVASHAHGATGIKNAIRAGVDTVDHASFIDDEGIRLARRNDTALVMDIYVTEYILGEGAAAGILEESLEKERRTGQTQRDNFRKAHAAGVRILFGTDAGVFPHGDNLKQLSRMVEFGMTPAEALSAATVLPARQLGMAGDIGEIRAGAAADLVIVNDNPLENITTVEAPVAVFKAGTRVR